MEFRARYGPWALVVGGSEGIGAAFVRELARRGVNVVAAARRPEPLAALARELGPRAELRRVCADAATPDGLDAIAGAVSGLEVGLLVHNAAHAPIGPLLDRPLADALRALDLNARAPLAMIHRIVPAMVERGRGGVVLVASLAGLQGSPRLAVYSATKAFELTLAEALWHELRPAGVDVLAIAAGAVRTPGLAATSRREPPGTVDAAEVARRALDRLGHGPLTIPGGVNRLSAHLLRRVLSRRAAIGLMAGQGAGLQPGA